eukprot:COSAG04_NODE_13091_length_620_cov_1.514395_3_plen_33_part_01
MRAWEGMRAWERGEGGRRTVADHLRVRVVLSEI